MGMHIGQRCQHGNFQASTRSQYCWARRDIVGIYFADAVRRCDNMVVEDAGANFDRRLQNDHDESVAFHHREHLKRTFSDLVNKADENCGVSNAVSYVKTDTDEFTDL